VHIIKPTSDQTIIFDDSEILILNNQYITKKQRFVIAIFGILIAASGIIFHYKDETIFFFTSYILLFIVWGSYFITYLIKKKDPELIKYKDLSRIEVTSYRKKNILKLYISNTAKPFRIITKHLDIELINFLKNKNLISFDK